MLNEVVMLDKRTGVRWRIRGARDEAYLKRALSMRLLAEYLPISVRVDRADFPPPGSASRRGV